MPIRNVIGEKTILYKAVFDAFFEFNVNYEVSFVLFQFPNHFDGLIGLSDIRNMNLSIAFTRNVLFNKFEEIPTAYNLN